MAGKSTTGDSDSHHQRHTCPEEDAPVTQDFFKAKRPWSKYKDFILGYYLEPYIPKVATLKKPILIVDCFAGCGRFGMIEAN